MSRYTPRLHRMKPLDRSIGCTVSRMYLRQLIKTGMKQALSEQTIPLSELWDDLE